MATETEWMGCYLQLTEGVFQTKKKVKHQEILQYNGENLEWPHFNFVLPLAYE